MVISVIAVLFRILLGAIGVVRTSAHSGAARAMIDGLHLALQVSASQDPQQRLPPLEMGSRPDFADQVLRTQMSTGGPPPTLDLLRRCGLEYRSDAMAGAEDGRDPCLAGPWRRAYRSVSDPADGVVTKPAPYADWNAHGLEPFTSVWSRGAPVGSGQTETCLYRRSTP